MFNSLSSGVYFAKWQCSMICFGEFLKMASNWHDAIKQTMHSIIINRECHVEGLDYVLAKFSPNK